MGSEELENLLRESIYFRSVLADLFRSTEQTVAIVIAAVARQIDAGQLAADILALQQEAALDESSPTRDHFLYTLRSRLRPPSTG